VHMVAHSCVSNSEMATAGINIVWIKKMTGVSLFAFPAAVLVLLAGCHGGYGRSALFSNTSIEEVRAAYINALTEDVHPSQVDAGLAPSAKKLESVGRGRPGRSWSSGVCRAEWSRVMDLMPSIWFSCREKASVSEEDDGRIKLTVWRWRRDSVVSSLTGSGVFSWLWNPDPPAARRRIAAVEKRISRKAKTRRHVARSHPVDAVAGSRLQNPEI